MEARVICIWMPAPPAGRRKTNAMCVRVSGGVWKGNRAEVPRIGASGYTIGVGCAVTSIVVTGTRDSVACGFSHGCIVGPGCPLLSQPVKSR